MEAVLKFIPDQEEKVMVVEKKIELFISEKESSILEAIALGEAPHSQRAQAILAADAGSNLEQAAGVAGLKTTQVRFWLGRFRNSRLQVFPEALIQEIEARQRLAQKKAEQKNKRNPKKGGVTVEKKEDKKKKNKKGGKKKTAVKEAKQAKKGKKSDKDKKAKKNKKAAQKKKKKSTKK
jgi:hypothetical protein